MTTAAPLNIAVALGLVCSPCALVGERRRRLGALLRDAMAGRDGGRIAAEDAIGAVISAALDAGVPHTRATELVNDALRAGVRPAGRGRCRRNAFYFLK